MQQQNYYFITFQETEWTAIFFAAQNDRVEILKHLLLHGAKPELSVYYKFELLVHVCMIKSVLI